MLCDMVCYAIRIFYTSTHLRHLRNEEADMKTLPSYIINMEAERRETLVARNSIKSLDSNHVRHFHVQ